MGGKYRQSRAIVECLRPYAEDGFTYAEPFCGGMWSAARVCRDLRPGRVILSDINKSLMLLWDRVLREGTDWLPTDPQEIEDNYQHYRRERSEDDPLTAWYGIACSFGGKWFAGLCRDYRSRVRPNNRYEESRNSTARKAGALRPYRPELSYGEYRGLFIPDGAVVYCDPPYEGRTKGHRFDTFDYGEFWQWVRDLSARCTVFTSCFDAPDDFRDVYRWGDTVTRHYRGRGSDGACERLVVCDAD